MFNCNYLKLCEYGDKSDVCRDSIRVFMKALYPLETGSPYLGTYPNSADPVQTPRTSASDHGLQCLLSGISK